jgi:hypothetical protein
MAAEQRNGAIAAERRAGAAAAAVRAPGMYLAPEHQVDGSAVGMVGRISSMIDERRRVGSGAEPTGVEAMQPLSVAPEAGSLRQVPVMAAPGGRG